METVKENEFGKTIQFKLIFEELLNRKILVSSIIIAGILISFFYTKFLCKPQYTACAKLLVNNVKNESTELDVTDFSTSYYLIRDYSEIILDKVVLSRVKDELNLDIGYGSLKGLITINNPSNSRILEIYVKASTGESAQKIANSICLVSKEEIKKIIGQDGVNIMSKAELPLAPSSPNMTKNLLYGFIIGCFVSGVTLIAIYYLDDKIKGADDVKKYLGITVLGIIPYTPSKPKDTRTAARELR